MSKQCLLLGGSDAQKYKQRPYQPRDAEEMQKITETIKRHRKAGDHFITIIEQCLKDWRDQFEKIRSENDTLESQTLATLVTELFKKIHERNPTADETPLPSTTSYPGRAHLRCSGPKPSGAQQSFMMSAQMSWRHFRSDRSELGGANGGEGGLQHWKVASAGQPSTRPPSTAS